MVRYAKPWSSQAWLPGEKFGYMTIQGLVTEMAGDFRLPRNDRFNNWQLSNTLISTRGRSFGTTNRGC